jgi:hypothetical protein
MSVMTPLVGTFTSFGTPVANGVLSFVLTNCGGSPTFGSLTPGPFTLSAGGVLTGSVAGNQATGCSEVSAGVNNSYYEVSLHDSSAALLWRRSFQIPVQTGTFNLATATPVSSIPVQVVKTGATGTAATIVVGTVSELAPGDVPTINNEGTSSSAILDFGIPGSGGSGGASAAPFGVISATVTDPSTLTPANADAYLLLAGGSGAWVGQTNSIALWASSSSSWIFFTPKLGEMVYILGQDVFLYWEGSSWAFVSNGAEGTVTGVFLTAPSRFTVTGSPVTTDGVLALIDNPVAANTVLRGPTSGANAAPVYGALVPADLPVATAIAFGAVKPDGNSITTVGGVLSAVTLPSTTVSVIGLVIDGSGNVPSTGSKGFVQVDFPCTIVGWTLLSDQTGSASIDVSKETYVNFPTMASIVASLPPTLTSAQKNSSNTLTGWTTSVAAGDIIGFTLTSVATVTRISLQIQVIKG